MSTILSILFSLIVALLLIHEMDAIRNSEWKMFIVLKSMQDSIAYKIFTFAHLPLYVTIIFLLISKNQNFLYYIVDYFLIIHLILHLFFEKHNQNKLKNWFSRSIIYSMGILATIHLISICLY